MMIETSFVMGACALLFSLTTCVFSILAYAEVKVLKATDGLMSVYPSDGLIGAELKKNMKEALMAEEETVRDDDIY